MSTVLKAIYIEIKCSQDSYTKSDCGEKNLKEWQKCTLNLTNLVTYVPTLHLAVYRSIEKTIYDINWINWKMMMEKKKV